MPSELDQMWVVASESELGLPETSLARLRAMASRLPFEPAVLNVAALQARLDPILTNATGHWELAQAFFAGRDDLLPGLEKFWSEGAMHVIFSPQALMLLSRVLMADARTASQRQLTDIEMSLLQDAVLGAHSAMEPFLTQPAPPTGEAPVEGPTELDLLGYELQAATFFERPPMLDEIARHREFLRLATSDPRLADSVDRVPVEDWLTDACAEVTADEQWVVGFGLVAITQLPSDPIFPHVLKEHVEDMLAKLQLPTLSPELPMISASRGGYQIAFDGFGGAAETMAWETRPFKARPFLRLANGDLLLLAPAWLLSWVGEGFHYRALTHAQTLSPALSAKYTRFVGKIAETYALDIAATATATSGLSVHGEQSYGRDGGARTTDVAILDRSDLVLFEIHARRVAAVAAVAGTATGAAKELSKLIVEKVDQIGVCIRAFLDGEATVPDLDLGTIERVWPVVVSVGNVTQTHNLWAYLRSAIKPETRIALARDRVQPLQVLRIIDYERLMGMVEAGRSLPAMLEHKTSGPFRDRDFASWLRTNPIPGPADARLSTIKQRWEEMSDEVLARQYLREETAARPNN
jgi:hypothetical protein